MEHRAADALSGFPTNGSDGTISEDDMPAMTVTRSNKEALMFTGIDTTDGSHDEMN